MNDGVTWFLGLLIVWLAWGQLKLYQKTEIRAVSSNDTVLAISIGECMVLVIAGVFVKDILTLAMAVIMAAMMYLMVFKQGIRNDGLTVCARWKEEYGWREIPYVMMEKSMHLCIRYYDHDDHLISKQEYKTEDYDRIMTVFRENNIEVKEHE